jgi:copper chaperone
MRRLNVEQDTVPAGKRCKVLVTSSEKKKGDKMLRPYMLNVSGMMCDNCRSAVSQALRDLPSLDDVEVNVETGTASFKFDEDIIRIETIVEAIEELGYDVLRPY